MEDADRLLVGAPFPGFDVEFQKQTERVTVTALNLADALGGGGHAVGIADFDPFLRSVGHLSCHMVNGHILIGRLQQKAALRWLMEKSLSP
jgi:hypothetical protein